MERNPYYWQVDTEGNQLPYIDKVEHSFFENDRRASTSGSPQGRSTCQKRHIERRHLHVLQGEREQGQLPGLQLALGQHRRPTSRTSDTPDPVLAQALRQAASSARRSRSRSTARRSTRWSGTGWLKPRQVSPVKGSPEYDTELETKWTEFDQKKANELLDKLGLTKGPDGIRLRADGKPLRADDRAHRQPRRPHARHARAGQARYWTAVGVKTNTRSRRSSATLYKEHCPQRRDRGRLLGLRPRLGGQGRPRPLARHDQRRPVGADVRPLVRPERLEEGGAAADHTIRKIWKLWDKTQTEPDEAKRQRALQADPQDPQGGPVRRSASSARRSRR